MLKDVIGANQTIIKGDVVVDGDVNKMVVGLVAVGFLAPIHLQIDLLASKVKSLILLVQVLLEELFG